MRRFAFTASRLFSLSLATDQTLGQLRFVDVAAGSSLFPAGSVLPIQTSRGQAAPTRSPGTGGTNPAGYWPPTCIFTSFAPPGKQLPANSRSYVNRFAD